MKADVIIWVAGFLSFVGGILAVTAFESMSARSQQAPTEQSAEVQP